MKNHTNLKIASAITVMLLALAASPAFSYEVTSSPSGSSDSVTIISGLGFTVPVEKYTSSQYTSTVVAPTFTWDLISVHETGLTIKTALRMGTGLSSSLPNISEELAFGYNLGIDLAVGFTALSPDSFFISLLGCMQTEYNSFSHSKINNFTSGGMSYEQEQTFDQWTLMFGGEIIIGIASRRDSGIYLDVAGGWIPFGEQHVGAKIENESRYECGYDKYNVQGSWAIIPSIGMYFTL